MEDPILEAFLFETSQQLGQLEQVVIEAESVGNYSENNVTWIPVSPHYDLPKGIKKPNTRVFVILFVSFSLVM